MHLMIHLPGHISHKGLRKSLRLCKILGVIPVVSNDHPILSMWPNADLRQYISCAYCPLHPPPLPGIHTLPASARGIASPF